MQQRHATDVVSLVFGTVFAGFTLVWLLHVTGHLDSDHGWWAGPVVLVVAGAAGLIASLRAGREPGELAAPDDFPEPAEPAS